MSVDERRSEQDLKSELQDLKTELAVQQATQAGAEATQAATQAGQAATNAAAHAGTWSTFVTGGVALSVGMFPGAGSRRRDTKVEPSATASQVGALCFQRVLLQHELGATS